VERTLSVLAAPFKVVEPEELARIVRETPTGGVAGRRPLDVAELERLRRLVIGDARFRRYGRKEATPTRESAMP
jgi:hypothetical protein